MKKTVYNIGDLLVLKRTMIIERNTYKDFLDRCFNKKNFREKSVRDNSLLWKDDTAPFICTSTVQINRADASIKIEKDSIATVVGYKKSFMSRIAIDYNDSRNDYDMRFILTKKNWYGASAIRVKSESFRVLHIQINGMLVACSLPSKKYFEPIDIFQQRTDKHEHAVTKLMLNDKKKLLKHEFDSKIQKVIKYADRLGLELS